MDCFSTDRAAEFSRLLAPDFGDLPIYVILSSQLPAGLPWNDPTSEGSTSGLLDVLARPYLGAGLWAGRGPAILLNDRDYQPSNLRLAHTFLHELAHALDPEFLSNYGKYPCDLVEEFLASGWKDGRDEPTRSDWNLHIHGANFKRTALHLSYRAWSHVGLLGFPEATSIYSANVISGDLGLALRYANAIGDEPERFRDRSFSWINDQPLPARFADVWEAEQQEFSYRQRAAAPAA